MKIGFIGLGIMGMPMCMNLLKAGHEVTVFDVNEAAVEKAVRNGAGRAPSCRQAAEGREAVITMLPNSPHVKEAVLGENGVLSGAAEGLIFIDMSSIAPGVSKELAAACGKAGVRMLDAPVSGGEPKAVDGTLSVMAGGERQLFEQMKELLLCMGSSAVYCGEVGAGNTTKLANQVIVALNIAACAEGFMLARKAGVDPELVFAAIKGGLAGSTVMNAKVPMMLGGDYQPGFKIDLHIKDLMNALDTAHETGAPLPLTAQVMEMLQNLHTDGCGQEDHSALAKFYEKLSGQEIGRKN